MNIETKKWEVLCSEEQIAYKLKELGTKISKDYEGKNLLVVSLLKGSFIFCADLVRNITVPVKIEFMTTSSYGHGKANTGVKVVPDFAKDNNFWRTNGFIGVSFQASDDMPFKESDTEYYHAANEIVRIHYAEYESSHITNRKADFKHAIYNETAKTHLIWSASETE